MVLNGILERNDGQLLHKVPNKYGVPTPILLLNSSVQSHLFVGPTNWKDQKT